MGKILKTKIEYFANAFNAVIEGVEAHNFAPFMDTNHEAARARSSSRRWNRPYCVSLQHAKDGLNTNINGSQARFKLRMGPYGFHSTDGLK